jgi:hypothetical protein
MNKLVEAFTFEVELLPPVSLHCEGVALIAKLVVLVMCLEVSLPELTCLCALQFGLERGLIHLMLEVDLLGPQLTISLFQLLLRGVDPPTKFLYL